MIENYHNHHFPIEALKLRDDYILVRPDPPSHEGSIEKPENARDKFGDVHFGEVVACGPGDTLLRYHCDECDRSFWFPRWKLFATIREMRKHTDAKGNVTAVTGPMVYHERQPSCCGRPPKRLPYRLKHASLGVQRGDRVAYIYGNDEVVIDGTLYYILHVEQHVLAVLEPEPDGTRNRLSEEAQVSV